MEELKNLDLNQASQNSNNEDAQERNQSQDSFVEVDKEISIKDDENQYKETIFHLLVGEEGQDLFYIKRINFLRLQEK